MLPGHLCKSLQQLCTNKSLFPCVKGHTHTHTHTHTHSMVSFIRRADLSFDLTQKSFCHEEFEIIDWPDMHPPPPSPPLSAFIFTFVSNFPYQPTDSFIQSKQSSSPLLLIPFKFPLLIWSSSLYLLESDLVHHCIFSYSFTLIWVIPFMELCK